MLYLQLTKSIDLNSPLVLKKHVGSGDRFIGHAFGQEL
jgi:hypothetical protein